VTGEDSPAAAVTIAVVVPTLDEEARLAGCLASIGDPPGVEVAVSDGGSRDGTLAIARDRFPHVRLVTGTRGRGGQQNHGAAATAAPVLLFLHADCRLPRGWREAVLAAVASPRVALGCFRLRTGPPDGAAAGALARAWWRLLDLRGRGWGLPYGDQALFLRRGVFDAVGGFPAIPLMEDVELVRRCLRRGRLARVPLEEVTTARRFARHPVRARLCTATFPSLYRFGVSPERLARWYGNAR
jgi:rSAM/selenodomain-associated transferase 2